MKKMKKLLSIFLAIAIVVTTTSISSISYGSMMYSNAGNGKIMINNSVECYIDINELAEEIQEEFLSLSFEEEYFYFYYASTNKVDVEDEDDVLRAQTEIEQELQHVVFTLNNDNPSLGQYFEKVGDVECWASIHPSMDVTIDDELYHTYGITIKVVHSLKEAEEKYVAKFAELFKENYIPANADDYTKVKTIYDFVIRNTVYDEELFQDKSGNNKGKYPHTSDRYNISHSAYGAITGNRLKYDPNNQAELLDNNEEYPHNNINTEYDSYETEEEKAEYINQKVRLDFENYFGYKTAINGEKIVELNVNRNNDVVPNGLAVCEGYSKLFYYLCIDNGIEARIVDGDYVDYISNDKQEIKDLYKEENDVTSGKKSDPHEWNYVKLDDGTGSGEKWYIIDSTWGSQFTIRNIDYNNYDYFLIGTHYDVYGEKTSLFSIKEHQQPYVENGPIPQLYNWYLTENQASEIDYDVPKIDLGAFEFKDDDVVIIERKTEYKDGTKCAYILQDARGGAVRITLDDDASLADNVGGFDYNGKTNAVYKMIIPYLTGYEYESIEKTGIANVGKYTLVTTGMIVDGAPTTFSVDFNITSVNMSKGSSHYQGNPQIDNVASYNGDAIQPKAIIVDGYGNELKAGRDFDIKVYEKGTKTETQLIEMGEYDISIVFKGNYNGTYDLDFTVAEIDFDYFELDYPLLYFPEYFRTQNGISSVGDYFQKGNQTLKIGSHTLKYGTDFTIVTEGDNLEYNGTGSMTVYAGENSSLVKAGTKIEGTYKISEKFGIDGKSSGANLNGTTVDAKNFVYDGVAKNPTSFEYLDKILGKENYKVKSCSNNINAGDATAIIEGINGCKGTATVNFKIIPKAITSAKVSTSASGTAVAVKVTLGDITLENGKDYSFKVEKESSTKYLITVTGCNNYQGTIKVNATVADPTANYVKPSSKNNKLKLSKTSYVYSGSACKPTVTLTNSSGKTVNTYYYTVSYSNNKNVGKATVTIKFRNGYSGSMSTTFKINPKATSLSSLSAASKGFTAKWKKQSTQTTGYELQYATDSKFTKNKKTVSITKNTTLSKKITKLTAKKKYYVRVRTYKTVSGTKYYSSWSSAKTVTTKK